MDDQQCGAMGVALPMTSPSATGRYLIYLFCFGEKFRRFATMAVKSAREIGGWSHDIVLLSDSAAPLAGCEDVMVIDMRAAVMERYPWATLRGNSLHHLKTEVDHHVDLARYDYVLYLDCDVLVTTRRLSDLVPALCRDCAIVVQQDIIAVVSGTGFAGGKILTKEEQRRWGEYAINAGVVGFPTTPMGRRLLRDWRQLGVDQHFNSRDQGNLVSLLLRKYHGQWGYITDAVIGRDLRPYEQTFVHFTNRKETLMEAYYKDILGLSLPE